MVWVAQHLSANFSGRFDSNLSNYLMNSYFHRFIYSPDWLKSIIYSPEHVLWNNDPKEPVSIGH